MSDELIKSLTKAANGEEPSDPQEEYKTWKTHTPFLYELVVTHALEWPSLTCQWLPDRIPSDRPGAAQHDVLLGTQTSGQDTDYLQVAQVQLPIADERGVGKDLDDVPGSPNARVSIVQRIVHKGDVNRARYNPLHSSLVATHGVGGELYVFDRDAHPATPETDEFRPDVVLTGQTQEGYGLAWCDKQDGLLLSASEDATVCLWDVAAAEGRRTLEPLKTFRDHTSVVEDCAFDPNSAERFASVGDDSKLYVWDTRQARPALSTVAGEGEVNALSWNSFSGGLVLATGGADKVVRVWDVRSLASPVHALERHEEQVLGLAFSPTEPAALASASADRRVILWDLSRIGEEQDPGDEEDGGPELLFQHGGHTATPTDLSWAPHEPWHLLTTAEDNVVQLWRPKETITDVLEVDPAELE